MMSLVVLIGVMIFAFAANPQSAHAGGGVGSGGGSGSGSSNGADSRKGWGWYDYASQSGITPYGFRNGDNWSRVSKICSDAGADRVIAFIVLTQPGTNASTGMVYDYHSSWDGFQGYRGNSGGGWLPTSTAKGYYDSINVNKIGYTWGSNVAWFCYSTAPAPNVPKPSGGPGQGTGQSAGCQPMLIDVSPGRDYNNAIVPVNVSTSLQSWGPYTSPATIDVTSTHTTGNQYTVNYVETRSYISDYTPIKDSFGTITGWNPVYSPARSWSSTIGPCYNYGLTPSIITDHDSSLVVEPSASVMVTPVVTNSGPTKSQTTQWQLTQIVVQPGTPIPVAAQNSLVPCSYFVGPGLACSMLSSGSSVFDAPAAAQPSYNATIGDFAVGTRICYAFSVQPHASSVPFAATDSYWAHSAPSPVPNCLIIGKKPKVQIWGGDLSAGKAFSGSTPLGPARVQTSTSKKTSASGTSSMFGSWIEYGIFATGQVTGAASGSAYAGPTGTSDSNYCDASTLSFKNTDINSQTCTSGNAVGYSNIPTRSIPDFAASFPGPGTFLATGSVSPASLASGTYRADNLTLTASTLAPGKSIILKVAGTVTIAGDQKYDNGPYTSIEQLPQLVILANKIVINSNVVNVDAWLIANGSAGVLETCDTGSSTYALTGGQQLTSNTCNQQLTVNGPVMAKQLWLRRTAGSGVGAASGDPAEVFNLRPDAFLWASVQATGSGRVQTVYTTELPPRL